MLYYFSLPIFSILLIVVQSTITDVIFANHFIFEISLVVVIYAGFHLDIIKGTMLALTLGIVQDCIAGSVLDYSRLLYKYFLVFFFHIRLD
jgi:rod shape-determining protein MreD